MRIVPIFVILVSIFNAPAHANDGVRDAANRVATCIETRNPTLCRDNLTANSLELFNRFEGYDLMDCLPQQAAYMSKKPIGKAMQVRAQITTNDKKSNIRLIFEQEENSWKLDIPESLRRGIGENWESQINATEQVYLMLKAQMGNNLNCGMIRNLAAGLTTEKAE